MKTMTAFSARIILFCVVLLCAVAMSACSTVPQAGPEPRTSIEQIPDMKQVQVPKLEPAVKPKLVVREIEGSRVPTLGNEGMAQLIDLYKHDGYATSTANSAVEVANAAIAERNRLLALAKAEEAEGNRLRAELHVEKEARKDERMWGNVELNATRALLLISILAGM